MSAIEVQNLCKTYREGWLRRRRFEALRGVSFAVPHGQVFGLLGPNGAGKTTFIKILLGIIRKSGGQATLLGHAAGSRAGRLQVGYLPESLRIPRHLTAHTALDYYGRLSNLSGRAIRSRRDELLELVGLASWAKTRVTKYSKGMLQRLGLAQAMLHQPQMLVLDEPTDGLDPRARAEVRAILRQLRDSGITVFLNSHILQEVEMVCDHVAILDRGNLLYSGSVSEIGAFVLRASRQARPGLQVTMRLAGAAQTIRQAIGELADLTAVDEQDEAVQIRMRVDDQATVDRAIDRLRALDVSLLALERERVTLEDAFLRLLADPAPPSPTSPASDPSTPSTPSP